MMNNNDLIKELSSSVDGKSYRVVSTDATEILNTSMLPTVMEYPRMNVSQIKPAQFPSLIKSPKIMSKK